jgi:hypothetical protein
MIRVKFSGRDPVETWLRQFPGLKPRWGRCEFIFDPSVEQYDWLVVYNDLSHACLEERLPCARDHSLLVTSEPSSIKSYGRAFTRQFGCVLTSQEEWALPHPQRIYSQPALQWFYGRNEKQCLSYDRMVAAPPLVKSRTIATVCSNKRQKHTLHNQRYEFVQRLRELLPELDVFGHGVKPMQDKAESLDNYRYHIAIENHRGLHHWTEKLADPFLGVALPFYSGCPNAGDYFPPESFIPIDINDPEGAAEIMLRAIRDDEYFKRLPFILESRRLVLEKYNLFAVLSGEIEHRFDAAAAPSPGARICSRRLLRKRNPAVAVQSFFEKCRSLLHNRF